MVTIVLSTYNDFRYVEERLNSILSQTYSDFECLVIDGCSTDGTFEYLKENTKTDKRFVFHQFPPKGPYDAWNKGIELAAEKYIYIATADDTMSPDCLEKMVKALEEHPEADFAHCNLEILNSKGEQHNSQWKDWAKIRFYGDWIRNEHIRPAKYDFFVYAGWGNVYASITQLLIKKDFYSRAGVFRTDLGSIADFEWGVRASYLGKLVHVPEYLATWRKYEGQLTNDIYFDTIEFIHDQIRLLNIAVISLRQQGCVISKQDLFDLVYVYKMKEFEKIEKSAGSTMSKIRLFLSFLLSDFKYCYYYLKTWRRSKVSTKVEDHVNSLLSKKGLFIQ